MPGIDSVHAQLASCFAEDAYPVSNILHLVRSRAPPCVIARYVFANTSLERNQIVGGSGDLLHVQVPREGIPESSTHPRCTSGRDAASSPHLENAAQRNPPRQKATEPAYRRPIKKSPHRMIELVVSYSNEINVVGQTDDERVPWGSRRNLDEWYPFARIQRLNTSMCMSSAGVCACSMPCPADNNDRTSSNKSYPTRTTASPLADVMRSPAIPPVAPRQRLPVQFSSNSAKSP